MQLSVCASLVLLSAIAHAVNNGPDYESLPLDTIFPGPWERNIRAPLDKTHITPVKIFNTEGAVSGAESVLQDADTSGGKSWIIGRGGLITFEFEENISGKYVTTIRRDGRIC